MLNDHSNPYIESTTVLSDYVYVGSIQKIEHDTGPLRFIADHVTCSQNLQSGHVIKL